MRYLSAFYANWKISRVPSKQNCISLILIGSLFIMSEIPQFFSGYLSIVSLPTFFERHLFDDVEAVEMKPFRQQDSDSVISSHRISDACSCSDICVAQMPIVMNFPTLFNYHRQALQFFFRLLQRLQ